MVREPDLVSKILCLSDLRQQAHKMHAWLGETAPEDALQSLDNWMQRAMEGDDDARQFLNPLLLTTVVLELLDANSRKEFCLLARQANRPLVSALFMELSPVAIAPLQAFPVQDVRPTRGSGRRDPITLGERKALAKTNDPRLIDKLLHDPDLGVARNLLENPYFQEKHVLKMVSRRPARREILQLVACHRRWGCHQRVRQALVLNPYTPPLLSVLSLLTAPLAHLDEVRGDENLHPFLRQVAEEITRRRPD